MKEKEIKKHLIISLPKPTSTKLSKATLEAQKVINQFSFPSKPTKSKEKKRWNLQKHYPICTLI